MASTLYAQLKEVACRVVNEHWWKACGPSRACDQLLAIAFVENWPRDGYNARVVLAYRKAQEVTGFVKLDHPGIQ